MQPKILWLLLVMIVSSVLVDIIAKFFHINLRDNNFSAMLVLSLPVIGLFLHAMWTLSYRRAIFFILLAFTIGLIAELLGLQNGTMFGGTYIYKQGGLTLWNVPLVVPFFWAVFIYTGYTIINSFLAWIHKDKPSIKNQLLAVLPLLILLDGFVVVLIDLFMDPLEVKAGSWTWLEGGPYFGVPIGNFVGWFIITVAVTTIFRLFEYVKPYKRNIDTSIYLIPVIGYGMLGISFFSTALYLGMPEVALVGIFLMLPIPLLNVLLFIYSKLK